MKYHHKKVGYIGKHPIVVLETGDHDFYFKKSIFLKLETYEAIRHRKDTVIDFYPNEQLTPLITILNTTYTVKTSSYTSYLIGYYPAIIKLPLGTTLIDGETFITYNEIKFVKYLYIPDTVTTITGDAFESCQNLLEVYLDNPFPPSYPHETNYLSYYNQYNTPIVYVPVGSLERYANSTDWRDLYLNGQIKEYISNKQVTEVLMNDTYYIPSSGESVEEAVTKYYNCYDNFRLETVSGCVEKVTFETPEFEENTSYVNTEVYKNVKLIINSKEVYSTFIIGLASEVEFPENLIPIKYTNLEAKLILPVFGQDTVALVKFILTSDVYNRDTKKIESYLIIDYKYTESFGLNTSVTESVTKTATVMVNALSTTVLIELKPLVVDTSTLGSFYVTPNGKIFDISDTGGTAYEINGWFNTYAGGVKDNTYTTYGEITTNNSITYIEYSYLGTYHVYCGYFCSGDADVVVLPRTVTTLKSGSLAPVKARVIVLPTSLQYIESTVFKYSTLEPDTTCIKLVYSGTIEQWKAIGKAPDWYKGYSITEVECIDGKVSVTLSFENLLTFLDRNCYGYYNSGYYYKCLGTLGIIFPASYVSRTSTTLYRSSRVIITSTTNMKPTFNLGFGDFTMILAVSINSSTNLASQSIDCAYDLSYTAYNSTWGDWMFEVWNDTYATSKGKDPGLVFSYKPSSSKCDFYTAKFTGVSGRYFCVLQRKDGILYFYVNGQLLKTEEFANSINPINPYVRWIINSQPLYMSAIYNTALSQTEIDAMMLFALKRYGVSFDGNITLE